MEDKRKTKRPYNESNRMLNRLSRIEGQVRGIKKMVENDGYCPDILVQVMAVKAAIDSFNRALLADHVKTCMINDIKEGKEGTVDELIDVLKKMMK